MDSRPYRLKLAALPDAPRRARAFLRELMNAWGLANQETADNALLLMSELVTNAVQATGRDSGPTWPLAFETISAVEVRAAVSRTGLVIEVWDNNPNPPTVNDLAAGQDSEHGRGMFLVAALADAWGWCPETMPPATTPGKKVWFLLQRDLAITPEPTVLPPTFVGLAYQWPCRRTESATGGGR